MIWARSANSTGNQAPTHFPGDQSISRLIVSATAIRSNQRQQVIRGTDALELRASVAHLDVTDRADGHTPAATPAGSFPALVALASARAATSTKAEASLRNGYHRHTLTLNGLTEDRRDVSLPAHRLADPAKKLAHQLRLPLCLHRHRGLPSVGQSYAAYSNQAASRSSLPQTTDEVDEPIGRLG